MENQRNLIIAVLLTALLLFGWEAGMNYFYPQPDQPTVAASSSASTKAAPAASLAPGATPPANAPAQVRDLKASLSSRAQVPIEAPGLVGSINLTGGLLDDISTVRHNAKLSKAEGLRRIFTPADTRNPYFAQLGWTAANGTTVALPGASTVWTAPAGAKLTPQSPVTLTWNNGAGQTFSLTYAIDADYMLTLTQGVANAGTAPIAVKPIAQLIRVKPSADDAESIDSFNVHSGPFGAFDEAVNFDIDYDTVAEAGTLRNAGKTDWIGFTDIYWMTTLIPGSGAEASDFRALDQGRYIADLFYGVSTIAPGQQASTATRLFAGAKESTVLDRYETAGISNFGLAIDWGWFRWFEKPIFWLLDWLFKQVGNFGVAIMALTVIVRGLMFPIAQRQFASMAAMKAIQPKMKAIQDRYADDKQKQQQEIMALYKKEGVNPLAGCLPIFLQIPIFFALYKVLIVAVEMRHQPFFLWIKDLSAPDPLHVLNLFGYLDFTPPAFLAIGILAILLGVTMWLQFRLNPAAMDPVQQQVFAIMPWMMMFIMAPFAAGLLLYWITSNVLTIGQQAYLYSKHPQLKAQATKDAADAERAKVRTS